MIVDATFREERRRRAFLEAAGAGACRPCSCSAGPSPDVVPRPPGPADAATPPTPTGPSTSGRPRLWEEPTPETRRHCVGIDCGGTRGQTAAAAIAALDAAGLYTAYNAFRRDGEADRISEGPACRSPPGRNPSVRPGRSRRVACRRRAGAQHQLTASTSITSCRPPRPPAADSPRPRRHADQAQGHPADRALQRDRPQPAADVQELVHLLAASCPGSPRRPPRR